ncbi:hypothetical protein AVEN_191932-1 [Araneus ventricosus]|uniref:Uncharacterized protein n=1 Tax=Araneus ventricosus TaxID=182803 RepID=A0A4Y2W509_ARAVE|nr:hypothetical protein AVEN_191932-1 [Araneus ventricosus]
MNQSNIVSGNLKHFYARTRGVANFIMIFAVQSLFLSVTAYYLFICKCLESFHREFAYRSHALITKNSQQRLLIVYREVNETTAFADDILSYPAFTTVLNGMIGLFSFAYHFIYHLNFMFLSNYIWLVTHIAGIILYSTFLLVIMLSGAGVNQAARISMETSEDLLWRFPENFAKLMKILRKRSSFAALTLWKIYTIEKSLFISAIGSLVTYGCLLGTMGSIQNLDSNANAT